MKSFLITGALLAALASAQPHAAHQHHNRHNKRAIVWETKVEVVTKTIDTTTTIWVEADDVPATTTSKSALSPAEFAQTTTAVTTTSSSSPSPTPTPSTSPSSSSTMPQVSSTAAEAEAAPSAAQAAPVVPQAANVAPENPATTSTPPVVVAPTSTSSTTPVASTPPSSGGSSGGSSSGYSGPCAAGSPCTGDITYYTAGLGACGFTNNGDVERIVALPHELMGTQSNGNPYCGKTITITKGGKSTTATVADKCMGCGGDSIDLSNAAFADLADFSVGRTTAEWHFN